MKINIVHLGPNEFFDRKSDIIYPLFSALTDLGHNASVSHNLIEKSALNIIIGSDIISPEPNALKALFDSKADYAIFEVENFNGSTINYRKNFDLNGYKELIEKSKFCFTPYLYNVSKLSKLINKNNILYTKWGFHPSMICNRIHRDGHFSYSAFFYGLIKSTRVPKIKALQNKLGNEFKTVDQKDPFTIRDFYISKSKIGLSLAYGEVDNFVNPFRLYHMVANGMPVLSDHSQDDDGYSSLCENSTFEELLENIGDFQPNSKILAERCRSEALTKSLSACF